MDDGRYRNTRMTGIMSRKSPDNVEWWRWAMLRDTWLENKPEDIAFKCNVPPESKYIEQDNAFQDARDRAIENDLRTRDVLKTIPRITVDAGNTFRRMVWGSLDVRYGNPTIRIYFADKPKKHFTGRMSVEWFDTLDENAKSIRAARYDVIRKSGGRTMRSFTDNEIIKYAYNNDAGMWTVTISHYRE